MAPDILKLSPYDTGNPLFWERYGGRGVLVDTAFYENRVKDKRTPRAWTKEIFCAGFQTYPGEYYRLRELVIPYVLPTGLHVAPKNAKDNVTNNTRDEVTQEKKKTMDEYDSKWEIRTIVKMIKKMIWYNSADRANVPVAWTDEWLLKFVKEGVIQWMRDHPAIFANPTVLATIITKNDRNEDIVATTKAAKVFLQQPTTWTFDHKTRRSPTAFHGYFQIQHLMIQFRFETGNTQTYIKMSSVEKNRSNITPDDVGTDALTFGRPVAQIDSDSVKAIIPFDGSRQTLWCFLPGLTDVPYWIYDDRTCQVAVRALGSFNDRTIKFYVFDNATVETSNMMNYFNEQPSNPFRKRRRASEQDQDTETRLASANGGEAGRKVTRKVRKVGF